MSTAGAQDAPAPSVKRSPTRTAIIILVRAIMLYVVAMLLWAPLAPASAAVLRVGSNITAAGVFRGPIKIEYLKGSIGARDADTFVHHKNLRDRTASATPLTMSSWYYLYVPMAMVSALTLATPIPWARRARALALGVVLMGLIVLGGQMLIVYDALASAGIVKVGLTWQGLVHHSAKVIKELPGSFFIPIIVYALVTFRRGELVTLFGAAEARR